MTSRVTLADIATIVRGVSYKGAFLDQPGPKMVGLGSIRPDFGVDTKKARTYGGPFKKEQICNSGDILVALTDITQNGKILGSASMLESTEDRYIFTHHVAAIRVKSSSIISPRYLSYYMQRQDTRNQIISCSTGTTVRAVAVRDIGQIPLEIPNLAKQQRIVRLLNPFDSKLYLVRALRIALHDLLLRQFERLQESCDVESDLIECIDLNPRLAIPRGIVTPFIEMKSLPTDGPILSGKISERPYSGGSKFIYGDTLLARITPCLENGKGCFVDFLPQGIAGAGSTEFIVLRPKSGFSKFWTYCISRQPEFRSYAISRMTGSSGRQRVSASALSTFNVRVPSKTSMSRFDAFAEPIFLRLSSLRHEEALIMRCRTAMIERLTV